MKALPEGKIFQLPEDPEKLFEDLPIECSPRWASERVRKNDIWVELGGPKHDYKSFVMVEVVDLDEINPGRIEIVGPDLDEIDSGSSFPFGYYIKLAGEKLNKDYEGFFERWAIDNHTRVEGVMYLNTRDTVWMRLHNRIKSKMNSFKYLPQAIMGIFLAQIPLVEAMESKIIIGTEELGGKGLMEEIIETECKPIWDARDAKALEVSDEDTDTFFGCTLCQSFAPNHCCTITPNRTPFCGVINWDNIRVGIEVDPSGYSYVLPKGETIDPVMGVYSGVTETMYARSNRTIKKINLYSAIKYPMTSCGCFEALLFYIDKLDGIGLTNRMFAGETPLGLPFSKLAGLCGGGVQYHGFCGVSMLTIKSKKFIGGDGGWDRIIWITKALKEKLSDVIPETHYALIPTEEDSTNVDELKHILIDRDHPIVKNFWKNRVPVPLELPGPGEFWPEDKHLISDDL